MTTCGYFGGLRRCGFGRRGGGGLLGLGWWLGGRSCASRGKSLTPPDRVGMNSGVSYSSGLRLGWCGLFGFGVGREAVVVVGLDGNADGFAPAVRAEGVDVFVLGDVYGLHESLDQVGDGVGGFGLYIAAHNGWDEACQGGAEIAGGEVVAGEEVGQVFAEFLCGAGAGLFLGVVEAETGIVADARRAATAAVGERKHTQGHAVLWTERGHKSLLRVEFWDCLLAEKSRQDAGATKMALKQKRLAGREAHYFTWVMYQSSDQVVNRKRRRIANLVKTPSFLIFTWCGMRGGKARGEALTVANGSTNMRRGSLGGAYVIPREKSPDHREFQGHWPGHRAEAGGKRCACRGSLLSQPGSGGGDIRENPQTWVGRIPGAGRRMPDGRGAPDLRASPIGVRVA